MTIAEMLARNARAYPNDIALVEVRPAQKQRLEVTWKEFDAAANRIAGALIDRGVRKGDKVIYLNTNCINWLETYFGIIRTGAWVTPLNYRFTAKDIQYCAEIAEAKVMILGDAYVEVVQAIREELSTVRSFIIAGEKIAPGMERLADIVRGQPAEAPDIVIEDADPCGLYFTSGTTGAPKPILLTHSNMECAAITENVHHHQHHDDNFILIPPLYHTGSKMHWFGSLMVGGRGTLLTEISPKAIFETVHREKGTIVFLLVPWAKDILVALDRGELKLSDYDFSSWRLMHIGAQPVPPSLVRHWKEYFPKMQYDTNYGLGEAAGPGCVHLGIENEHKVGAIGKAGFNWETRIVDDTGRDVTVGEKGEILIRGNGLMKKYYKNPQKTHEALREGWLHTGDIVRQDEEGFIYIVDRKKDVVISGGENIYPVEIEEVIHMHPKVYDVGVIGIPDERLGEAVAAIVDPRPGVTLTEAEILEFCDHNLPRYRRPRHVFFDKVPRNPTGKIEKPKLRAKYAPEGLITAQTK
jgi:acyl-CoA synthetase (AMP-forming)/AMP-acid ligase II